MFEKIRQVKEMARMAKDSMKSQFVQNEKAEMHASGTFGKIIGLFLIAILIGALFVTGLQQLANANTSGLSTTEVALIAVVGLILIVGVLWLILEYVGLV